MYKTVRTLKFINRRDIKEKLGKIDGASRTYVTESGCIYADYGHDRLFKKKTFINKYNGYLYVNVIMDDGTTKQFRVHRLVAKAFLPNPNNYPIVMHKDNNKANPHINNLKWGTVSENTKNAFDDGLIINDKGFDDSQSHPVCVFDTKFNLLYTYGSMRIAAKKTGVTTTAVSQQCKHNTKNPHKKPKSGYYYRLLSEYKKNGFVL